MASCQYMQSVVKHIQIPKATFNLEHLNIQADISAPIVLMSRVCTYLE